MPFQNNYKFSLNSVEWNTIIYTYFWETKIITSFWLDLIVVKVLDNDSANIIPIGSRVSQNMDFQTSIEKLRHKIENQNWRLILFERDVQLSISDLSRIESTSAYIGYRFQKSREMRFVITIKIYTKKKLS